MKTKINLLLAAVLMTAMASKADILKLKQGGGVQGILVSANSRELVFMGIDGAQRTYPTTAVAGIDFAPLPPPPPPPPPPPAPESGVATVPVGTQITVRTVDAIDGKTANAGARYRASIDDPVALGNLIVIPRGTDCTLEVVNIESGEGMALRIRSISMGGKMYSTSTQYAEVEATGSSKGAKAAKRGIGLGALGAGIGAIAGGGKGAAVGAVVGGGLGAASGAAAKGKQISVPTETRLIFALVAPLPLN
jgi:hypothetical protein